MFLFALGRTRFYGRVLWWLGAATSTTVRAAARPPATWANAPCRAAAQARSRERRAGATPGAWRSSARPHRERRPGARLPDSRRAKDRVSRRYSPADRAGVAGACGAGCPSPCFSSCSRCPSAAARWGEPCVAPKAGRAVSTSASARAAVQPSAWASAASQPAAAPSGGVMILTSTTPSAASALAAAAAYLSPGSSASGQITIRRWVSGIQSDLPTALDPLGLVTAIQSGRSWP